MGSKKKQTLKAPPGNFTEQKAKQGKGRWAGIAASERRGWLSEAPWGREDPTHTCSELHSQGPFPTPNLSPSPQVASCWTPRCSSRPRPHPSARGGNSRSYSGSARRPWPPAYTGEKLCKKAAFRTFLHVLGMSSDSMQS